MDAIDVTQLTAVEIAEGVKKRRFSAEAVVSAYLERIAATDGDIHSFLTVMSDEALQQARDIDRRIAMNENVGPLAGVPIAVKDNICTRGVRTTAASRMLEDFIPPFDATVIQRLRDADAVIIGKTNLDEFAMGSSTENSAFGNTRNPWDLERVPGGSSGGSAAAVAASQAPLALGSDTGGSIRQPAAFCGVVGLKPTYGRVSRHGLIAMAPSLDHIGPLAGTVSDVALLLQVIAGHDEYDGTSARQAVPDYMAALNGDIRGTRIGVVDEYMAYAEPTVLTRIHEAIDMLKSRGAVVETVSLPHTRYVPATYQAIMAAEASSSLARYDGIRYGHRSNFATKSVVDLTARSRGEGFGPEVKRRVLLGTYILLKENQAQYFYKAQQLRQIIKREFDEALQKFDLLLMPAAPTPAFPLGSRLDPQEMYRADLCTPALNLAGVPGISLPCGFVDGLPVGLQLVGRPFAEEVLLRVAKVYQDQAKFHRHRPPLSQPSGGELS